MDKGNSHGETNPTQGGYDLEIQYRASFQTTLSHRVATNPS